MSVQNSSADIAPSVFNAGARRVRKEKRGRRWEKKEERRIGEREEKLLSFANPITNLKQELGFIVLGTALLNSASFLIASYLKEALVFLAGGVQLNFTSQQGTDAVAAGPGLGRQITSFPSSSFLPLFWQKPQPGFHYKCRELLRAQACRRMLLSPWFSLYLLWLCVWLHT